MEKYDLRENMMELPGSPFYPVDTKMETMEIVSDMDGEQLQKQKTECAIAKKKVEQSQRIDIIIRSRAEKLCIVFRYDTRSTFIPVAQSKICQRKVAHKLTNPGNIVK